MTETKIETCDLCERPLDANDYRPCGCAAVWGANLVLTHRDRKYGRDLIPLNVFTRAGTSLRVAGGVDLPRFRGQWIALYGVTIDGATYQHVGATYDHVEIRLDDIAFIGFNLP